MTGHCGHCNHEHIHEDQCANADCDCTEFDLFDKRLCRCGHVASCHKVGDHFGTCGAIGCNCGNFIQADSWFMGRTHLDMSQVVFFTLESIAGGEGHTVYVSMTRESIRLEGGDVDAFLQSFYNFKGWELPKDLEEDGEGPSRRILLQENE